MVVLQSFRPMNRAQESRLRSDSFVAVALYATAGLTVIQREHWRFDTVNSNLKRGIRWELRTSLNQDRTSSCACSSSTRPKRWKGWLLEKEADEVRRILIDELNRTFITPMDREDIFALSRAIDDVIDYAYATVEEMVILDVKPNTFLQRMVSLLREASYEIHLAMLRLKENPNVANDHAIRAKALENQMEHIYREAIAELFRGPEDIHHVMEMLKLRELYRHLSNCADRGDEAANVITDIVIKMA
jgi:uncharacterized protein Yka (UPF0111/DUF47 family)